MLDRFDTIIVGGGIVGMCCAHYLQQAGHQVLVLDRGRYSEAASTGNAGMIVPSHIVPLSAPGVIAKGLKWLMNPESPLYIKPSANPQFMKWLWLFQKHCTAAHVEMAVPVLRDLSLFSVELFDEICALSGFEDVGLEHNGLLMLHHGAMAQKDNEELADLAESAGLHIERLNREATLDLEPAIKSDITGSVFFKQDASLHPERLLRSMEAHLKKNGVQFKDVEVSRFGKPENGVPAVVTAEGRFEANRVVLAAGSWTGELTRKLGHTLPVQPAKGYSISVPVEEPTLRIPCILADEKVTITPMPGSIRFGGTLALQGFDASIDMRRAAPIRRQAERYCGEGIDEPVWSGFRPASPDGLPFIGELPGMKGVSVATGHGMMGVTLAPVTGKLIAEQIMGESPSLDGHPFRIDRY